MKSKILIFNPDFETLCAFRVFTSQQCRPFMIQAFRLYSDNMKIAVFIFCLGLFSLVLSSCEDPYESENLGVDEFLIQDDLRIELVAAEPLLDSPVAMAFDPNKTGRIWVVELPGYMRDIDGNDEQKADGRIVVLDDLDSDGVMDQRTVFLDSLVTPRTLAHVYGGLLYSESTNLWWQPLPVGSGARQLVDSLYVVGGNIEHQPNGLFYNLDNWIYSANCNVRYRRIDERWQKEVTTYRGQWGLSADNAGRLFYNNNGVPVAADFAMPNRLTANRWQKVRYGEVQLLTDDRRLFPIQATAVNRGYQDGVLDSLGRVREFTSACSPLVFYGDKLPADFYGDVFVCAPEANLVKRLRIVETGVRLRAVQAYEGAEFLISRDESFRPVNLYNGPDGALYVLDLRKGVIQHRAYMTHYLRDKILQRGLDKINGKGRIYRISGKLGSITQPELADFGSEDWLDALQSRNGWLQRLAQMHIQQIAGDTLGAEILEVALNPSKPSTQIAALWLMQGLGILNGDAMLRVLEKSPSPKVLGQLILLAAELPELERGKRNNIFEQGFDRQDPSIDFHLLQVLGSYSDPQLVNMWRTLALRHRNDPVFVEAAISSIEGREAQWLSALPARPADSLTSFLGAAASNARQYSSQWSALPTATFRDDRTNGMVKYNQLCASCHGLDGKGKAELAPPLVGSRYLDDAVDESVLILLHGLEGPLTIAGKQYGFNQAMPGFKDNSMLSNRDIADILIFARNAYGTDAWQITEERVSELRALTVERQKMFTVPELKQFVDKLENGE